MMPLTGDIFCEMSYTYNKVDSCLVHVVAITIVTTYLVP